MAFITTCRFCEQNAINGDHSSCAEAFGANLGDKLLAHAMNHPELSQPPENQALMSGDKWQAYQDYLKLIEREKGRDAHMEKIKDLISADVRALLEKEENRKQFESRLARFEHYNFQYVLRVGVDVSVVLVF